MQEWLEERSSELADLEVRRIFGGSGVYAEGTMFGSSSAGRVYSRTDDDARRLHRAGLGGISFG